MSKDRRFKVLPISELPWNAKMVRVQRASGGIRKSYQQALFEFEGVIYSALWREFDIREQPNMHQCWRALTGMKDKDLRAARKQWLEDRQKRRIGEHIDSIREQAAQQGFRLVRDKRLG